MKDRIEEKKRIRFILLQKLYQLLDGNERASYRAGTFYKELSDLGIATNDAQEAFVWLQREGLAKQMGMGTVAITHDGVREIEEAQDNPANGTDHFPLALIQNVNFYGTVGGVQTGSDNTMNVAQQFNAPAAIIDHFATIRREIEKLPPDKKADAIELVDAMEAETKSEKPKLALITSFAASLATIATTVAPHLPAIIEWSRTLVK